MLQLSSMEGGGQSAASLLGLTIVSLLGLMVCIPIIKCLYRMTRCCKKKSVEIQGEDYVPTMTDSFKYRPETLAYNGPLESQKFSPQPIWTPSVPHFPPQVPHHPFTPPQGKAWDEVDLAGDPVETGPYGGTQANDQEVLPDPPSMEEAMQTLQYNDTSEDQEFVMEETDNNLVKRIRRMKRKAEERLDKA